MVSAGAWESKGPGSFTNELWAGFFSLFELKYSRLRKEVTLCLYSLSVKMATCMYVNF